MTAYVHVVLLAVSVGVFALALVLLSRWLGPKHPSESKARTYESGIPVKGRLLGRVSVPFAMAAILFLPFSVAVVFLFPWAVQQDAAPRWAVWFFQGALFAGIWMVGWLYAVKSGALDWGSPYGPEEDEPATKL